MSSNPSTLEPDALLDTASILAKSIPTDDLDGVRATLEYLYHSDKDLAPRALRETAPCDLSNSDAEDIVFQLAVEGIMNDENLNERALRDVFVGAKLVAAEESPPENTVVATIPYDDRALDPGMFESIHGNLLDLIKTAEDSLVLMSPFLSERAYERLRPALHTAADNGAEITLVTRYLTYGDEDYNREFANAIADDEILAPKTTKYEYIDDETWTTFHAKVVIADGVQAYLGTANITHRGLGDNLELGVIFRDDTAKRFADLMEALRQSEYLHEVERSGGQHSRL